jgi:hypothetical protein
MELFCENHLAIFIPLPFFKVEPINIVLTEELDGTRLQDISFHWVPISSLLRPKFAQQYLSSFNF